MPRFSVNKTAAYARSTASLLGRNQADLLTKGYNATTPIADMNSGADNLPVTDETQENAKSQQMDATTAVTTDTRDAYHNASGALKTASGLLGKTGTAADEASRLRAEVTGKTNAPQVSAFLTSVVAYLNSHKAALIAKSWDPTAKITELTSLATLLTTEKGAQEGKKGARGGATTAIDAATDALFNLTNGHLEATMNLYPADSEFTKEGLRIRAALRGRDPNPPPAGPTPPTPPPGP